MELVTKFLSFVISKLPQSPFVSFIDALADIPFLSHLNYFIPISTFIGIGEAWLVAIGVFYLYSIIMDPHHLIERGYCYDSLLFRNAWIRQIIAYGRSALLVD